MDPEHGDERAQTPGLTLWPIGLAVGIACILVGLIISWWVVAAGAVIAIVFGFLWIYDLMRTPKPAKPEVAPADETARPRPGLGEKQQTTRKGFVGGLTVGLGAVIGAAVVLPPTIFAVLPPFKKNEGFTDIDVDLGPLENYPKDQWLVAQFNLLHGQSVNARTAYVRYNGQLKDAETGKTVPSFTIISNRCVHLGCPVQPNGPLSLNDRKAVGAEPTKVELTPVLPSGFGCPCHGGQYDTEGNRTAGPPVRALDRYEYAIRRGRLRLVGFYSVGEVTGTGKEASITKYKLAAPGIHVDDWEQILYPFTPPS